MGIGLDPSNGGGTILSARRFRESDRGRMYWRPNQCRVWINGKFFDLGARPKDAAKRVAAEFGFRFIDQTYHA